MHQIVLSTNSFETWLFQAPHAASQDVFVSGESDVFQLPLVRCDNVAFSLTVWIDLCRPAGGMQLFIGGGHKACTCGHGLVLWEVTVLWEVGLGRMLSHLSRLD